MIRIFRVFTYSILAISIVAIFSCTYKTHRIDYLISKVKIGDTEFSVINSLGQPNFRELQNSPYLRYTGAACATPCVVRLWWEAPLFSGIEAWSVEIDHDQKVIDTYHWVSP